MLKTRFTVIATALLVALTAYGATAQAASLTQQRQIYIKAQQALKSGDTTTYAQLKPQLTGYPLYPYLLQQALERDLNQVTQSQIDTYSEQYSSLPGTYLLQRRWLSHLAKSQHWPQYLTAFTKAGIDKERFRCWRHQALLQTGKTDQALDGIERLWNQGHSVSEHCDPIFRHWMRHAGGPSSTLAYQRFWKAVDNNNIKLARYLQKFVTDTQQRSDVQLFFTVRKKPQLLIDNDKLLSHTPAAAPIYLHGLQRLARSEPIRAAQRWISIREQLKIPASRRIAANRAISQRLVKLDDQNTYSLLDSLNSPVDSEIQDRRIVRALSQQNWQQVYSLIHALDKDDQSSEARIYWKTIAASHIRGLKPAYSDAFISLSQQRSYYGLLASQVLDTHFHLNPEQRRIPDSELSEMRTETAVQRMRELYHHNELYLARREWNQHTQGMSPEQLRVISTVVQDWGWYSLAIRGAAASKYWDDIGLRFPLPHNDAFKHWTEAFSIDTNWARAIARQESAYLASARSPVGARGLMQLMPATAKATARKNKVKYRRVSELNTPTLNINLGVAYLAEMQKRFQGNQIYATAAYNAGPHRVDRWLKQRGELPIDIWIETIPFRETRKYVMSVMAYHAIYQTLAGQPGHILPRQTAFRLAMKDSTGASQSTQLRQYIKQHPLTADTTQTQ